jgi:hypothetical protein
MKAIIINEKNRDKIAARTSHIDVRTCNYTLSQMLRHIDAIRAENPDCEVFLDGDTHTIMTEPRRDRA